MPHEWTPKCSDLTPCEFFPVRLHKGEGVQEKALHTAGLGCMDSQTTFLTRQHISGHLRKPVDITGAYVELYRFAFISLFMKVMNKVCIRNMDFFTRGFFSP